MAQPAKPLRRSQRVRESHKLTESQRSQLQDLLDEVDDKVELIGDPDWELNGAQTPCRRLKKNASWTAKNPNKITKWPKVLKLTHIAWMLFKGIVCPTTDEGEMSHICVDPNRKKGARSARCFEGSHLEFETHKENKSRDPCHNAIDKWVSNNRNNSDAVTTGTIYLSNVAADLGVDEVGLCKHTPLCFGNYGQINEQD